MEFDCAIEEIEHTIGYTFRDRSLLRQAFTRKSYCNEAHQAGRCEVESNEVLEFCGDSVLSAAIITILMERCSRRSPIGLSTALDEHDEVIGYQFVRLGKMMEDIRHGMTPNEAYEKNIGQYGRYDGAAKYIDPREE